MTQGREATRMEPIEDDAAPRLYDGGFDASAGGGPALTWRAWGRLAEQVTANGAMGPAPAGGEGGAEDDDPRSRRKPTRRARLAAAARADWARQKWAVLEDLRELRETVEPACQSPDFASAALFAPPALSELPVLEGEAGAPDRPFDEDDRGEAAERYRALLRVRAGYLERRAQEMRARRLAPHNCWARVGPAGERGGLRPGQRAFPGAWARYLLRVDADGPGGDGWNSPVGRAFRRLEREGDGAASPLCRAVWAYTEPRIASERAALDAVMATLDCARREAAAWIEAGARRLVAEAAGFEGAKPEWVRWLRDRAERAEAAAWATRAAMARSA